MSWESFRLRLIEHPHGTFFLGELSLLKTSHLSLVPGKHYKEVQIHHSWDQLQAFEDAFWILTLRCKYLYLHYKCNVYNMSVLSLDVLLMRSEFCHFDAQVTLPLYTFEQLRLHISMQIQTLIVLEHTLLRLRHTHKTTTIGDRCWVQAFEDAFWTLAPSGVQRWLSFAAAPTFYLLHCIAVQGRGRGVLRKRDKNGIDSIRRRIWFAAILGCNSFSRFGAVLNPLGSQRSVLKGWGETKSDQVDRFILWL